jgi:hypothetical protein
MHPLQCRKEDNGVLPLPGHSGALSSSSLWLSRCTATSRESTWGRFTRTTCVLCGYMGRQYCSSHDSATCMSRQYRRCAPTAWNPLPFSLVVPVLVFGAGCPVQQSYRLGVAAAAVYTAGSRQRVSSGNSTERLSVGTSMHVHSMHVGDARRELVGAGCAVAHAVATGALHGT